MVSSEQDSSASSSPTNPTPTHEEDEEEVTIKSKSNPFLDDDIYGADSSNDEIKKTRNAQSDVEFF